MKILGAFLMVLICVPVFAQVEELEAQVSGSSCSSCFYAAVLTLKQLPGVVDAVGDPREGWIKISVNPKKGISIKDAQERVKIAGFKDDARFVMKATGTVEQRGDKTVFVVPNQEEVFVVDAGDREKMVANASSSQVRIWTSGILSANGKQYDLKIEKIHKQ